MLIGEGGGALVNSAMESSNNKYMRSLIAQRSCILGYKNYELAKKMGLPRSTFYAKLKEPDRFSLGEIRAICKILKISAVDASGII